MKPFKTLFAFITLAMPCALNAQVGVISDVSNTQVPINATFNGEDLLVFGAMTGDNNIDRDLIVSIEGPSETLEIHKKDRIGGLWINKDSLTIHDVPSYIAVTSTAPFDEIIAPDQRQLYRIGLEDSLSAEMLDENSSTKEIDFIGALKRIREDRGLYLEMENAISLRDNALYSVTVPLPANLRDGLFQVRSYVLIDGQVVSRTLSTVNVRKAGLERWLYRLSRNNPFLYGIFAIFIAICVALFARQLSAVFKR